MDGSPLVYSSLVACGGCDHHYMDGSPLVYSSLVACDGGDHHATWMAVLLSIVAWWRVAEVITTTWMAVLLSIVAWWRVTEVITTLHGWQSSCL